MLLSVVLLTVLRNSLLFELIQIKEKLVVMIIHFTPVMLFLKLRFIVRVFRDRVLLGCGCHEHGLRWVHRVRLVRLIGDNESLHLLGKLSLRGMHQWSTLVWGRDIIEPHVVLLLLLDRRKILQIEVTKRHRVEIIHSD